MRLIFSLLLAMWVIGGAAAQDATAPDVVDEEIFVMQDGHTWTGWYDERKQAIGVDNGPGHALLWMGVNPDNILSRKPTPEAEQERQRREDAAAAKKRADEDAADDARARELHAQMQALTDEEKQRQAAEKARLAEIADHSAREQRADYWQKKRGVTFDPATMSVQDMDAKIAAMDAQAASGQVAATTGETAAVQPSATTQPTPAPGQADANPTDADQGGPDQDDQAAQDKAAREAARLARIQFMQQMEDAQRRFTAATSSDPAVNAQHQAFAEMTDKMDHAQRNLPSVMHFARLAISLLPLFFVLPRMLYCRTLSRSLTLTHDRHGVSPRLAYLLWIPVFGLGLNIYLVYNVMQAWRAKFAASRPNETLVMQVSGWISACLFGASMLPLIALFWGVVWAMAFDVGLPTFAWFAVLSLIAYVVFWTRLVSFNIRFAEGDAGAAMPLPQRLRKTWQDAVSSYGMVRVVVVVGITVGLAVYRLIPASTPATYHGPYEGPAEIQRSSEAMVDLYDHQKFDRIYEATEDEGRTLPKDLYARAMGIEYALSGQVVLGAQTRYSLRTEDGEELAQVHYDGTSEAGGKCRLLLTYHHDHGQWRLREFDVAGGR